MKTNEDQEATPATSSDNARSEPQVRMISVPVPVIDYCCQHCGKAVQVPNPIAVTQVMQCDEWWTVEQAAAYLHLKPKSVREGAARGALPGHKYPACSPRGKWLFRKVELDKSLMKPAAPRRRPSQSVWG